MSRVPTPEQRRAIEAGAADILLQAGAGTGKTTVLVDRYCELIAGSELGPERILAFTFTEKAAAQLRERIRRELTARAADPATGEETARKLRDAAERLGSGWVTTIHGFCRRVLASHPVAAGIDPRFTVLDAPAADRLARGAFEDALERFLSEAADEADAAAREETAAVYGPAQLREMIVGAHAELRGHGRLRPALPPPPEADPEAALAELERAAAELFAGEYRKHGGTDAKIRAAQAIAASRADWLDVPESCAEKLAELEAVRFKSSSDGKDTVAACLRQAISCLAVAVDGRSRYEHVRRLLELFGERFAARKSARSGLDFDDLQLMTADLLSSKPDIGAIYRERFAHLMIDEFQDTSPAQIALIKALHGPETAVFRVGDEFQSIYGFRHADLASFRRERFRLQGDPAGEVLPLLGNFRSRAEILCFANELGAQLLDGFQPLTVGSAEQGEREPRGGGGSGTELIVTAPDGWEEAPNRPAPPEGVSLKRGAEAEALAERLAELARYGVPRGDMVVLLRALGPAETYAAALERRGLRPFVIGGRGFWSGREVGDAIALTRSLANPLDDTALLGALASPACAATPDALWILRRATGSDRPLWPAVERVAALAGVGGRDGANGGRAGGVAGNPGDAMSAAPGSDTGLRESEWLERLADDDRAAIAELHARVTALRERAPSLGLGSLIELAVEATGCDLAALSRPRGAAGLAGLRKLIGLAEEYESAEGRDLRGFLDYADFQAREADEAEAATAAEGHDGVRLMTIHAAKGLEFPVVAIPELGRKLSGSPGGSPLAIDLGPDGELRVGLKVKRFGADTVDLYEMEAITEERKARDCEEELRLFYVAMTRAEERLILSGQGAPLPKDGIGDGTPILTRILDLWGMSVEPGMAPPDGGPPLIAAAEPRAGLEATLPPATPALRFNWPLDPGSQSASGSQESDSEREELDAIRGESRPVRDAPDSGRETAYGDAARAAVGSGDAHDSSSVAGGSSSSSDEASGFPLLEALPPPPRQLPLLSFTSLSAFEADPEGFRRRWLLGTREEDESTGTNEEDDEPGTGDQTTGTGDEHDERGAGERTAGAAAEHANDRETDAVHASNGDADAAEEDGGLGSAYGSAVHELLERALIAKASRNEWRPPTRRQIEETLRRHGAGGPAARKAADPATRETEGSAAQRIEGPTARDTEDPAALANRAEQQIEGWLASELCEETRRPKVRLRAEVPLLLNLDGALIRGEIDLLAEPPEGPPLIVDYKTNRLAGRSPAEVAAGYELQQQIYALAVARATGAGSVRVAYVMLEQPAAPCEAEFGPAELEAAAEALARRVRALVGSEPPAPESGLLEPGSELVQA